MIDIPGHLFSVSVAALRPRTARPIHSSFLIAGAMVLLTSHE